MSSDVIALAVICVLVLVIIWQSHNSGNGNGNGNGNGSGSSGSVAASGTPPQNHGGSGGGHNSSWGGYGPTDYSAPPVRPRWPNSNMSQHGLAYSGVPPDRIAEAEREAWYTSDATIETFATDPATASHSADPASGGDPGGMDYARYTTDLVVDPRMRENHRKWIEELGPWAGGLRSIDTMDEAMEATTAFTGLQRPQGVAVHNPTQVTELGPEIFASNHKFRFNG